MIYPADHFPGTPKLAIWTIQAAREDLGLGAQWQQPLEAIMRFESDMDPWATHPSGSRGVMGLTDAQVLAYIPFAAGSGSTLLLEPQVNVEAAAEYIRGNLEGYGGYGGLGRVDGPVWELGTGRRRGLLSCKDRGPGDVLRAWIATPTLTYSKLRTFYHGY